MENFRIVVNEYQDSVTGHTNVSFFNADGILEGTFGANIKDLDHNPLNGWEGGIFNETGSRTPIHQTSFNVSEEKFNSLKGYVDTQVYKTLIQDEMNYNILAENCVDFVENLLNRGNIDHDITSMFQGTLLDTYATTRHYLTTGWDYFYKEMLNGNYNILDTVSELFQTFWDTLKEMGGSDAYGKVSEDQVKASETIYSPIAIDLNGDGLHTSSVWKSQVYFDLDGNGTKEKTGWLNAQDGFLAIDRNGDGIINNGNELFGGGVRGEGLAKLAILDMNHDGVINVNDATYTQLLVWRDFNCDGQSSADELYSLAQLNISEISLNYHREDIFDNANLIGEHSLAMISGQKVEVADIYFRTEIIN